MGKEVRDMEKVALITGSSRGIGRAAALRLARDGYAVCINYLRRWDKAEELQTLLELEGCRAMSFQADVADKAAVDAMADAVRERFGPVTLLVSNAGIAGQIQFQDVTEAQWDRYFGVNVKGAYNAIQAVLPDMLHAHAGTIVTVSSMWGLRGASCEVVYSATKAALIGHGAGPGRRDAAGARAGDAAGPSRHAGGHRGGHRLFRLGAVELHHRPGADRRRRLYPLGAAPRISFVIPLFL